MAEESGKRGWLTPVRVNLLVIALLIAILNGASSSSFIWQSHPKGYQNL